MIAALLAIAVFTLVTAAAALSRRNLIHCALLLVASWAGVATFYLWAGAEFVAFAQFLIYVGAISMVVLFAVLLTRHSLAEVQLAPDATSRVLAAAITGGAVFGLLCGAIISSPLPPAPAQAPALPVRELGLQLMGPHAAALLVAGALLTAATLGAIVIAAVDRKPAKEDAA